jgi:hypothetical protein
MKHRTATAGLLLTLLLAAGPALAQPAAPPADDSGIVVEPEKPKVAPPDGDPRSSGQRAEDHAQFNKCVLKMQNRDPQPFDGPTQDPYAYCSSKLGMSSPDATPSGTIRPAGK